MKTFSMVLILTLLFTACKKEKNGTNTCLPNAPSLRTILNQKATVKLYPDGKFYLIEMGTIDTRLQPCNLPVEFQVDNLNVSVTGEVYSIVEPLPGPCCLEGLVIFKISL